LHIVWTVRQQMPCRFDELFEVPAAFASLRQLRDPRLWRWLRLRRARRRYTRFIDIPEASRLVADGSSFAVLEPPPGVMIRTFERFFPSVAPFVDLVPVMPLRLALGALREQLPRMIGVHIRRQDNRRSIETSSTVEFLRQMRTELTREPTTEFFLATDDPREEARLRQEFGALIHTYPKHTARRRDPQAARDAVVDLYGLAACRKLLGSHYSSFTDTAAAIRGIPLQIVGR
jgi:hypothetical protein